MSLKDADIKDSYFLNGAAPYFFYNELYLHAKEITIALGYFSRSAFCIGTEALLSFIKGGGKMRLICNDKLLIEDAEAIAAGYELKEKGGITLQDFEALISAKDNTQQQIFSYKCLSYMIAIGQLNISVCKSDALVHFKTGYAADAEGNVVAFTGSVNYTLSALLFNWEQLSAFCSWKEPASYIASRISEIVEPVQRLAAGNVEGLKLVTGKEIESLIRKSYTAESEAELEKEVLALRSAFKVSLHNKKIKAVVTNAPPLAFRHLRFTRRARIKSPQ